MRSQIQKNRYKSLMNKRIKTNRINLLERAGTKLPVDKFLLFEQGKINTSVMFGENADVNIPIDRGVSILGLMSQHLKGLMPQYLRIKRNKS